MPIKTLAGMAILILGSIRGCTGTYGNISKQSGTVDKITLAELTENWDNFHIFYDTRSGRWAGAIMFDPKDNDTKLIGDSWIKIKDQKTLNEKIKEIQNLYDYANVGVIKGPNDQAFGYMYFSNRLHIPIKVVDPQTLYVGSLPPFRSVP
jgi:hypothetical protein